LFSVVVYSGGSEREQLRKQSFFAQLLIFPLSSTLVKAQLFETLSRRGTEVVEPCIAEGSVWRKVEEKRKRKERALRESSGASTVRRPGSLSDLRTGLALVAAIAEGCSGRARLAIAGGRGREVRREEGRKGKRRVDALSPKGATPRPARYGSQTSVSCTHK
jgi:hypothetical protein